MRRAPEVPAATWPRPRRGSRASRTRPASGPGARVVPRRPRGAIHGGERIRPEAGRYGWRVGGPGGPRQQLSGNHSCQQQLRTRRLVRGAAPPLCLPGEPGRHTVGWCAGRRESACAREPTRWPSVEPVRGVTAGETFKFTDYTRRGSCRSFLGRGFDSPRLHHLVPTIPSRRPRRGAVVRSIGVPGVVGVGVNVAGAACGRRKRPAASVSRRAAGIHRTGPTGPVLSA